MIVILRMIIKFKKTKENAVLPTYAHLTDAGFNLYSTENYSLIPGERYAFNIGLISEFPEGYFVVIKPRSGLAVKSGIDVLAGIIDSGYRGEWGIVLINLGQEVYEFKIGDKIAQGIILPYKQAQIEESETLGESDRGVGGFGSTGR